MLNKLDILSGLGVALCVAYEIDGERWSTAGRRRGPRSSGPCRSTRNSRAGTADPRRPESMADLPTEARRTWTALERAAGVPIMLVCVGPERTQTIERAGGRAPRPPTAA